MKSFRVQDPMDEESEDLDAAFGNPGDAASENKFFVPFESDKRIYCFRKEARGKSRGNFAISIHRIKQPEPPGESRVELESEEDSVAISLEDSELASNFNLICAKQAVDLNYGVFVPRKKGWDGGNRFFLLAYFFF